MARLSFLLLLFLAACGALRAESYAETTLKEIVRDQKTIFADAEAQGEKMNLEDMRTQLQQLSHRYDLLVRDNPDFTAAYVSYGLLLNKVGMKKEALRLFTKANQLDSNLAVVKNQLGNLIAEAGQPLEALPYFLAAIDLEPREPLYHYQLGTLLVEAMDDFLKSGKWTRELLDRNALRAFREANRLAPSDWRYAYRYGLAFYDVEKPDWEAALAFWQAFEPRVEKGLEQQICRLHQAKVLLELQRRDEALALLDTVTEASLQQHKTTLLSPPAPAAETVPSTVEGPSPTPHP